MSEALNLIAVPLHFDFMQRAFLVAFLAAIPAGLLSPFVVLRGWSLLGDAIAHAVFPGVVVAYMLALPVVIGAFFAGLLTALLSGKIANTSPIKADACLGIVFSGMFAVGLLLFGWAEIGVHIHDLLFGDVLGVDADALRDTAFAAIAVGLVVLFFRRRLLLYVFDPLYLGTIGQRRELVHYLFLALVALAVVIALKSVGILLAINLLIAPGATAFLIARRFNAMLIASAVISALTSVVGVYASYFLDASPAGTIVLLQALLFALIFACARDAKRA